MPHARRQTFSASVRLHCGGGEDRFSRRQFDPRYFSSTTHSGKTRLRAGCSRWGRLAKSGISTRESAAPGGFQAPNLWTRSRLKIPQNAEKWPILSPFLQNLWTSPNSSTGARPQVVRQFAILRSTGLTAWILRSDWPGAISLVSMPTLLLLREEVEQMGIWSTLRSTDRREHSKWQEWPAA